MSTRDKIDDVLLSRGIVSGAERAEIANAILSAIRAEQEQGKYAGEIVRWNEGMPGEFVSVVGDFLGLPHGTKLYTRPPISPDAQAETSMPAKTVNLHGFVLRTNKGYADWCKTQYQPDALDDKGMASLHGLWAWQEQERRIVPLHAERDALQARCEALEKSLRNLHSLVWGECPSLLNEDSGGNSALDMEIHAAIAQGEGK